MIMHTVGSTDIQSITCSARGKQYLVVQDKRSIYYVRYPNLAIYYCLTMASGHYLPILYHSLQFVLLIYFCTSTYTYQLSFMTLVWVTSLAVPHQPADLSLHSDWYNKGALGLKKKTWGRFFFSSGLWVD